MNSPGINLDAKFWRGLGAIYGMTMMRQGLEAGLSAWFGGILFDLTDGYNVLFCISIFSTLVCIALFWIMPEIRLSGLDRVKG